MQLIRLRSQIDAVRWIAGHPLNEGRRGSALLRWVSTQIRSHLSDQPRLVPFIDQTQLYIGPGLTAANMQHFAGLGEPDVMGFLMHYLRPDDLFVDVGANIGIMTVLASGVAGARTVAIEPDTGANVWLERNIRANELDGLVRRIASAVGEHAGELRMTAGLGAANRAAMAHEPNVQIVPCQTLDRLLADEHPTVLKADLEGFELPMIRGATAVLGDERLCAAVIELKNHGARHGFDENEIRSTMKGRGFSAFSYNPLQRRLIPLAECRKPPPNTIFLRDAAAAAERVRSAPARRVIWGRQV